MTSSTWIFESSEPLHSCGIDAEAVSRFEAVALEESPMPLVFSKEEAAHARTAEHPAETLCICFCAKEAVLKALETPYDFRSCRLFPDAGAGAAPILLDDDLAREHGVLTKGRLEYRHSDGGGEVIAAAYLFCEEDDH